MRILKRTALVLVIVLLVYIVAAFFCKSKVHVERSIAVKAEAATIFNQINTLKNWKNWSYWDNIDKNMKSVYSGPEAGVGAKHSWESASDSVGKGTLTITKSEPNKFVETELAFEGMGTSLGGWKINDSAGTVTVSTYMDINVDFLFRPMMAMMNMDEMLGSDFNKSLSNLKNYCEKLPANPELKIEATTIGPMKMLTIKDSADESNISQKLGELYGQIGAVMKKQNLNMAGAPFAFYDHVQDLEGGKMKFVLRAGITIDRAGKTDGRVEYSEMRGGNVVKGMHYGSYESTGISHDLMQKWMQENGKTIIGSPWETYVTDPMTVADTSKWLTEIYYPVK